jgi:hypothetical protein
MFLDNIYSQLKLVNELNFHLSEELINLNDNNVLDVINDCGFDSLVIATDTITGLLNITIINPGLGYDTIILSLDNTEQIRKLSASSRTLSRRVEIIYFKGKSAKDYTISDFNGMNLTSFRFDYSGKLKLKSVENNEGCLIMEFRFRLNNRSSLYTVSLYKDCVYYASYVFNKRGKLVNFVIDGNDNYPSESQEHGYSFEKGKLIERKVTLPK